MTACHASSLGSLQKVALENNSSPAIISRCCASDGPGTSLASLDTAG